MAATPLTFEDFHRRCLKVCSRFSRPKDDSCIICTEKYDNAEHRAIRIKVKTTTPCKHVFCETCLQEMFSRRRVQDGANKCPLCRAVWFEAEYESPDAERRRVMDAAQNPDTSEQDWETFFTPVGWDGQMRAATRLVSTFHRLNEMFRSPTNTEQRQRASARSVSTSGIFSFRPTHAPDATTRPTPGSPSVNRRGVGVDFFEDLAALGDDQVAQGEYWDEQIRLLRQHTAERTEVARNIQWDEQQRRPQR